MPASLKGTFHGDDISGGSPWKAGLTLQSGTNNCNMTCFLRILVFVAWRIILYTHALQHRPYFTATVNTCINVHFILSLDFPVSPNKCSCAQLTWHVHRVKHLNWATDRQSSSASLILTRITFQGFGISAGWVSLPLNPVYTICCRDVQLRFV